MRILSVEAKQVEGVENVLDPINPTAAKNRGTDLQRELMNREEIVWWAVSDLNAGPSGCKPDALTAELTARCV